MAIPYDQVTDRSLELGVKSDLFDRRVRLNVAAFRTEYKDLQQLVRVSPVNFTFVTQNGGDAEIYGIEFEGTAKITRDLTAFGQLSLVHDKLENLNPLSQAAILGATRLNATPRTSGQVGFDWRYPFQAGSQTWTFLLGADAFYSSGYFASSDNTLFAKPYTLVNAFIGIAAPGTIGSFADVSAISATNANCCAAPPAPAAATPSSRSGPWPS